MMPAREFIDSSEEDSQHDGVRIEMNDKAGYYVGDCVDDKPHGHGILKFLPHCDDVYEGKHVPHITLSVSDVCCLYFRAVCQRCVPWYGCVPVCERPDIQRAVGTGQEARWRYAEVS